LPPLAAFVVLFFVSKSKPVSPVVPAEQPLYYIICIMWEYAAEAEPIREEVQGLPQERNLVAVMAEAPPGELCAPRRAKQRLETGVNDLATTHPEVAALWAADLNGGLTPQQVLPGSNKKVWWRCGKGHTWQAMPYALTLSGSRCPCCAGKKVIPGETDLATRYPEVAKLWDSERNEISPGEVMPATKRKFWWRCEQGHHWQAAAYSVTLLNSGCPYCSGHKTVTGKTDLATRYPQAAELWAEDRNGEPASAVAPASRKTAWWRCGKGHLWQAQIHSVVSGRSRCPVCAGRYRRRGEEALQSRLEASV